MLMMTSALHSYYAIDDLIGDSGYWWMKVVSQRLFVFILFWEETLDDTPIPPAYRSNAFTVSSMSVVSKEE